MKRRLFPYIYNNAIFFVFLFFDSLKSRIISCSCYLFLHPSFRPRPWREWKEGKKKMKQKTNQRRNFKIFFFYAFERFNHSVIKKINLHPSTTPHHHAISLPPPNFALHLHRKESTYFNDFVWHFKTSVSTTLIGWLWRHVRSRLSF